MVWGDGGAYATWFASAPEQIHGINMLPVTGGHFYMGNDPAYVRRNYAEMVTNAGHEPALWQDIAWQYLALGDGDAALAKFRANSGYTPPRRARPGRTRSTGSATSPPSARPISPSPPTIRCTGCSARTAPRRTSRPTSPTRR
nr:hypothetical protein GCM10020092_055630 [Actinoplanes digitatis]